MSPEPTIPTRTARVLSILEAASRPLSLAKILHLLREPGATTGDISATLAPLVSRGLVRRVRCRDKRARVLYRRVYRRRLEALLTESQIREIQDRYKHRNCRHGVFKDLMELADSCLEALGIDVREKLAPVAVVVAPSAPSDGLLPAPVPEVFPPVVACSRGCGRARHKGFCKKTETPISGGA